MEMSEGISIAELTDLAANLGREVSQEVPIRAAVIAGRPDKLVERLNRLVDSIENKPLADALPERRKSTLPGGLPGPGFSMTSSSAAQ